LRIGVLTSVSITVWRTPATIVVMLPSFGMR
jgi:hypothetical protein